MRRTDKERLMAERVITSRTRNAVLKLAQEDHRSATDLEAVRLTAMVKTEEDERVAAYRVITSRTRDASLALSQEARLTDET